jgi:hypothetical protein
MPKGARVFKLKSPDDDEMAYINSSSDDHSDPPPLRPGNQLDFQLGIYKVSHELKICNDGMEATINNNRMPTKAAMLSLIRDHGLTKKAAQDALNMAQRSRGERFRIKYAAPYDPTQQPSFAPSFPEPLSGTDSVMGSGLPTTYSQETEVPMPALRGLPRHPTNYSAPPDPQVIQSLQQAAQSGQKEVLDTSAFAGLLKSTRDDTMIDQYLPDLVKGLDRYGRILFNMYYHGDEFAERYGKDKVPELEDSIRNAFDAAGDVTLQLKQKAIDPMGGDGIDVDLKTTANS